MEVSWAPVSVIFVIISEFDLFSAVTGIIGTAQALETIKILSGVGGIQSHTLLYLVIELNIRYSYWKITVVGWLLFHFQNCEVEKQAERVCSLWRKSDYIKACRLSSVLLLSIFRQGKIYFWFL
jgi:hypothetical protein